jgi:hypothetical protein
MIFWKIQNHKYPFCIIKHYQEEGPVETMAVLALVLDCMKFWKITHSSYDGKEHILEVVIVSEIGKKRHCNH